MPLRSRKPTSPGRRFQTVSDFAEITRRPRREVAPRLQAEHRRSQQLRPQDLPPPGGGHKQQYRIIDFRRNKDGVPAKVAAIEYDPNRNARIALLHYLDGEKRYILAPAQVRGGRPAPVRPGAEIRPGNALPLRYIPVGSVVHNVELARAAAATGPWRRHQRAAGGQGGRLRHPAAALHRDAPGAHRLPGHPRLVGTPRPS